MDPQTAEVPRHEPVARDEPPADLLLVEDDLATQQWVAADLRLHGARVDTAPTLWHAVQMLSTAPNAYRCVIADLELPDSDGVDAITALADSTDQPIVVFSAYAEGSVAERARAAGATLVVNKALGTEDLWSAIVSVGQAPRADLQPTPQASLGLATPTDHESVVADCLAFLDEQLPMGTWMFTRVQGDHWIVLDAVGNEYGIQRGDVLRWSDSFCSRMVVGDGPRVTTEAKSLEVYRDAPVASALDIETYVGIPLAIDGVGLFGTLCGISPSPVQQPLTDLEPFLVKIAQLLTAVVGLDMKRAQLDRQLEMATAASTTDPLTGLANRRAFDLILQMEEARCRRFGATAGVVVIDLNGLKQANDTLGHAAGDELIVSAAREISRRLRPSDVAFRIGGDEFAVVAPGCDDLAATMLGDRLRADMAAAGVSAAVGAAARDPHRTLEDALRKADVRMYEDKSAGRG